MITQIVNLPMRSKTVSFGMDVHKPNGGGVGLGNGTWEGIGIIFGRCEG